MRLKDVSHLMYLLKLIDQKISSDFEKKVGFSLTRFEMLQVLGEIEPCLQNQLQEKMQIDSAAITRHLKILEDKGLVQRERNPQNGREILVRTTLKATETLATCEAKKTDFQKDSDAFLTEDEVQELERLLSKLNDQL